MIDLADIKAWLGIQSGDTDQDDALTALEADMVAFVEEQTGRYFGATASKVRVYDGNGLPRLWLRNTPNSITTVEVRGVEGLGLGSSWTTVDPGNYDIDGRGLLALYGEWPLGRSNVRVTASEGYASGEEPKDIRRAVMELVESEFHNRQTGTPALVQDQTINIPRTVKATLERWRIPAGL